jgi:hypothetical protein
MDARLIRQCSGEFAYSLVIAGLDPAIQLEPAPALQVDARIESGHDKQGCVPFVSLH